MVAKYKHKRHLEEQARDGHTKYINLEGSNRMDAKKEVRQGLKDAGDNTDMMIRLEEEWDREMAMASECYRRAKNEEGYKCTCFKHYHP